MDTVTEAKMAIALGKAGGMGVVHRNLSIHKQSIEVLKVKNKYLVGAAVGTTFDDLDRAKSLIDNGVDMIVIDTAHGHTKTVLNSIKQNKKNCFKYFFMRR